MVKMNPRNSKCGPWFPWERGRAKRGSSVMLGLKGKCYFSLGLIDRKGLPRWLSGKESTCQCRRCRKLVSDPWVRKIPWRKKWQPTPVFLPEKLQRSLVGYSPWGRKEYVSTHTHTDIHTHMHNLIEGTLKQGSEGHIPHDTLPLLKGKHGQFVYFLY